MQLVAYGAQDIYLTGNPQITFFKVVYRRHTNFSMEAIKQSFEGDVGAGESDVTCTISRNGDLVHKLWLEVKMPKGFDLNREASVTATTPPPFYWTNNTGHALIKECEIEIGGQLIDRHYSEWLDIWNTLTDHDEQEWDGLNKILKDTHDDAGNTSNSNDHIELQGDYSHVHVPSYMEDGPAPNTLYIPLKFWFCRNPGLALPLIALQYHEVKIKITTRNTLHLLNTDIGRLLVTDLPVWKSGKGAPQKFELWADYIYLDTDERRRFAQVSHEYLIEQVQRQTGSMKTNLNLELNLNHPVKELIWVFRHTNPGIGSAGEETPSDRGANLNTSTNRPWGGTVGAGTSVVDIPSFMSNNDYFNYYINASVDGLGADYTGEVIHNWQTHESFTTMKLELNGHDRFEKRNASYFRLCQPIQAGHKEPNNHIYVYSFALKPEEHQPSGTCNFSRIDNAQMIFTGVPSGTGVSTGNIYVFAVNYNVLRIMSGMGGLAYSN